jgi:hypothetical protein
MKEQTVDAAIAAIGNKVNLSGGAMVGFGWLASNEAAVIIGIVVALLGFVVSWVYKRRDTNILREFQQKQLDILEKESNQRMKYESLKYKQLEDEITVTQNTHHKQQG